MKHMLHTIFLTSDVGPHITRYQMYKTLSTISDLGFKGAKVLDISGSRRLINVMGLNVGNISNADYPEHDLLNLQFEEDTFDYVVSDQVLEHVNGDPFLAVQQIKKILKPGGYAIVTTCFINPIHNHPGDFWRFTEDGLRCLFSDFTNIICAGAWGNRFVWFIDAIGMRFTPIPNRHWHPLNKIATYNEQEWPIVTWIVAQK